MSKVDSAAPEKRPARFFYWNPPEATVIKIGAERSDFLLPKIPLPLLEPVSSGDVPSAVAIGEGLIARLRQSPDCDLNSDYAHLLEKAFPYLLSDLAAQTVMLEHKAVDPAYLHRKLNALKILMLLQPENGGLNRQIGQVAMDMAQELPLLESCPDLLLEARRFFEQACELQPEEAANWNQLGQTSYLLGDYSRAAAGFSRAAELLGEHPVSTQLRQQVAAIDSDHTPQPALALQLQQAGQGLTMLERQQWHAGRELLEPLDNNGLFLNEFPSSEILILLAEAQARSGALQLAAASLEKVLIFASDHAAAKEGLRKLKQGEVWP